MHPPLLSDAVEIGVVTTNMNDMRQFYGETLGLKYESELAFPGGVMHRYHLGAAIIKLVSYDTPQNTRLLRAAGLAPKATDTFQWV
jgi:catechol 2,3-dioxygenase-like lactoylglutathione lyase family enzyme